MPKEPTTISSLVAHFISSDTKYFQDRKKKPERIPSSKFQILSPNLSWCSCATEKNKSLAIRSICSLDSATAVGYHMRTKTLSPKPANWKHSPDISPLLDFDSLLAVWFLSSVDLLWPHFFPCRFQPHILKLMVHCYLLHCLWNTKFNIIK